MRYIKKELRHIRYRICRNIYYADQCPVENRKNYSTIGKTVASAMGISVMVLALLIILVTMA